jgi:phage replication-related protein YjqB (UPF0714/DUF867 family)
MTTFAELLQAPGVIEESEHRSAVGFLALHGGLEEATAEIAWTAADRSGASWYSVVQPDAMRAHVPSHRMGPETSPVLAGFLDHCDVVVSLHGFGQANLWTSVLVGGAERPLAVELATTLRAALPVYEILDDLDRIPVGLRGLDPRNPVNRTRGGGVQLELPPRVRGVGPFWAEDRAAGLRPHTAALVHALARFAAERT